MIVLAARHGETTWNLAGRYQGRLESSLSALGVRQGLALGEALTHAKPRVQRIVSSPLLRCTATAQFVADRLDVRVETDDRLIEIGHGDWEGRLRDEIMQSEPQLWYLWKNKPTDAVFSSGDTMQKVAERWYDFISEQTFMVPTLVVTHDAVARAAICLAQGISLDEMWKVKMENAAYARFDAAGDVLRLIDPCVNEHLDGLRADVAKQAL